MPGTKRYKKMDKKINKIAARKQRYRLVVEHNSEHSDLVHCVNDLTAATSDVLEKTVIVASLTGTTSDLSSTSQPNLLDTSHVTSTDHDLSLQEREKEYTTHGVDDNFLLNIFDSITTGQAYFLFMDHNSFSQDGMDKALITACRRGHKFIVQALIRAGANIQCKDENGNTPLLICAANGFTDIVRCLITRHADINAANYDGNTALILSIRSAGSTEMAKFLIEQKGININHKNREGYTALMKALEAMDVEVVKMLLEEYVTHNIRQRSRVVHGEDFEWDFLNETKNFKGESTTQIAIQSGLGKVLEILQEHIITGILPLDIAIQKCDTESFDIVLNCLLSDNSGRTESVDDVFAKMFTKSEANDVKTFNDSEIKIIKKLLEYGVKFNRSCRDVTPVSVAVKAGNYTLVELLCKHGVNVSQYFCNPELNPLNIAAKNGRCDLIELLLKYSAVVNSNTYSESALNSALIHGHIDCAKLLIQSGSQIDIKSALQSSVQQQMSKYVNFLFENYEQEVIALVLKETGNDYDLLTSAVKGGNIEIIGQILSTGIDINRENKLGITPLMESKNRQVAEFLIQRGANVNQVVKGWYGQETPLTQVLRNRFIDASPIRCESQTLCSRPKNVSSSTEVVQVLLENGATVNVKCWDGKTPLMMIASVEGSESMLQILLDHGADVNDIDTDGNTALIHAVLGKCSQNMSCLIKLSKDKQRLINLQNNDGLTALMYAVDHRNINVMTDLIEQGADINIKDLNGNTALLRTVTKFCRHEADFLKALVNAGSDINCQNNDGLSPLMIAAQNNKNATISLLLDSGADVNAVSIKDNKKTALSFLPICGFLGPETISCLKSLLDKGASPSCLSPDILHKTILLGQTLIVLTLIRRGLGPADVKLNKLWLRSIKPSMISSVSPLCVALLAGHVSLARYFVGNLFLTNSDLSLLTYNKDLRRVIERRRNQDCLDFLEEISSQPMSLFKLSFVTVSSAVDACPGRENRVNMLPLPQIMKDKLLFKSQDNLSLSLQNVKPTAGRQVKIIRHRIVYVPHRNTSD